MLPPLEARAPGRGFGSITTVSESVRSQSSLQGQCPHLVVREQVLITVRSLVTYGYLRLPAPVRRLVGPSVPPGNRLRASKLHTRNAPASARWRSWRRSVSCVAASDDTDRPTDCGS